MTQEKNTEDLKQTDSIPFFRSMRWTLLIWFLLLSIIPLAVVGVVSYMQAQNTITADVHAKLMAVREIKGNEIARLFHSWEVDVLDVASDPQVVFDIGDLSAGFNYLGSEEVRSLYLGKGALEDAEDGSAYSAVHQAEHAFFSGYTRIHGYKDALLIDLDGNVVYSTNKGDVFGANLVSGRYKESNLTDLYRRLKDSPPGQTHVVDAALFGEEIAMFMGAPIYQGNIPVGILVYQLPFGQINEIIQERTGMGKTGETYLAGQDMRMRSDSFLDPEGHSVRASFAGTVEKNGVDTPASRNALAGKSGVDITFDYRGGRVLSAYAPLDVKGLKWAIISEIEADEIFAPAMVLKWIVIILLSVTAIVVLLLAWFITRRMVLPVMRLTDWSRKIAEGDLSYVEIAAPSNEIGVLNESFREAVTSLREAASERDRNNWLNTGQSELEDQMRGDQPIDELCKNIMTFIANYLEVQVGTLYVNEGEGIFKLKASYAYKTRKNLSNEFKTGEGLIGQAALEKQPIVLTNVPDDYITITSSLGKKKPKNILVMPLIYNETVMGVLEVGSFEEFSELQTTFLEQISEWISIAINSSQARVQLQNTLEVTQNQAEELETQQEELKAANEELEEQTQKLQASEEHLKAQQEELQVTNEELEEKTHALEVERKEVIEKNRELENIGMNLEQKARELEITSRYKSEFLANMSHELRTPLNSLLILAQHLASNKKNNLDKDQVESATIIEKSGHELLNLINEILDLSKIEAGRMSIHIEEVRLSEIISNITANYKPLADDKGLDLITNISKDLPETIKTDQQRLDQIIRNLMSNAVKFTEKGKMTVDFHKPVSGANLSRSGLDPDKSVALSVTDTGIGIPKDKQLEIFEAFQQANGSTSRIYGGTGLGLSISRELARLLGGEIQLSSEKGKGSTFTLYLPIEGVKLETRNSKLETGDLKLERMGRPEREFQVSNFKSQPSIPDDRDDIKENERVILVIEDDTKFAKTLYRLCHDRDFKCIHAGDGETGLEIANKFKPDAIMLDIRLPGIEGWGVLEALKSNTKTRHIPVHMISVEEETIDAYKKGAIGYLTKPVTEEQLEQAFSKIKDAIEKDIKNLLIVEDDKVMRKSIIKLLGNSDVKCKAVGTGKEALKELGSRSYDCMILDLNLPDISGFEVLNRLDESGEIPIPPVIVYTGKDLTREEEYELQKYASTIIIKGVRSQERLLDETALFLHRVVGNLPARKRKMISTLYDKDTLFQGKKILMVDDDMRNVFVISKILEERGMEVYKAPDGQKALDILDKNPDIDLVLMDIMMPVMDGYEAMNEIRNSKLETRNVPIIALTAKAMREDRDLCISAGANDYIPKPVEIDRLLSLMRVWLYK